MPVPNDVAFPGINFPGAGSAFRGANPEVAFQSWMNGQYIPPALRQSIQAMFSNLYTDYLAKGTNILDQKGGPLESGSRQTDFGQENVYNPGRVSNSPLARSMGSPAYHTQTNLPSWLQPRKAGSLNDVPSFESFLGGVNPIQYIMHILSGGGMTAPGTAQRQSSSLGGSFGATRGGII